MNPNRSAGAIAYYGRIMKSRELTPVEAKRYKAALAAKDTPGDGYGWSKAETDRLCDLLAEGYGMTSAARMLGKTRNSVMSRFNRIRRQMGWQAN